MRIVIAGAGMAGLNAALVLGLYVGWRKRFPRSSAEQESQLAVANELYEQSRNRSVKIDLTSGIRSLEPFLDLSATDFLSDVKGQEIGRDVFINFDAKQLSDS